MPRNLSAGWLTEALNTKARPIQFFEGEFKSRTLRLCSGIGDIPWGGVDWLGNGWFEPVDGLLETEDFGIEDIIIRLNAVPSAVISLILTESKRNAFGKVWLGFLNESNQVIADPALIIPQAYFNYADINEAAEGSDVTLYYKSDFLDLEKTREFRWNNESQKIFYPEDKGFIYVDGLADKTLWWGPKKEEPKEKKRKRPKQEKGKGSRKRRN